MKRCTRCGASKDEADFPKRAASRDGLDPKCRACAAEVSRANYARNTERVLERSRAYRHANRERLRPTRASWRRANAERMRSARQKWAAAHPDLDREAKKRYRDANPEKGRAVVLARRARIAGSRLFGRVSLQAVRQRDRDLCWLCGQPVTEAELSFDHAVPLKLGGEHSERNLRVAHRSCNSRKQAQVVTHQMLLM